MNTITVRVPATSANLGPGFDALGLALAWHDEVRVSSGGRGLRVDVEGEGAAEVPRDERHLVAATLLATLDRLGAPQPGGLHLRCTNRIPHARGLGSSAAAIVAGVAAAGALAGGLPDEDVLEIAAAVEGHPDNVAACVLGGLTVAWTDAAGRGRAVRLEPRPDLTPVVLVPPTTSSTSVARGLLPATVPHVDAARNAARSALLVAALTGGPAAAPDDGVLLAATEDRLHQDYREPAMPETLALVRDLRRRRVPAVVSGAGPSVLVLTGGPALPPLPSGWQARACAVDGVGVDIRDDPAG